MTESNILLIKVQSVWDDRPHLCDRVFYLLRFSLFEMTGLIYVTGSNILLIKVQFVWDDRLDLCDRV